MDGDQLLLDACGLINLSVTGCVDDIAAFFGDLYVVEDVGVEAPGALLAAPAIRILTLRDDEVALFVRLAAIDGMDAGEAATFAVAASREFAVVTDDRRAIRAAREHAPTTAIRRTATVVRAYVEGVGLPTARARLLLQAIEDEASFRPAPSTPDSDWWAQVRAGD